MTKMSPRERTLLIIFAVLLAGALYYLFFLSPLQTKTTQVAGEISDAEDNLDTAQIKLQKKKSMQDELDKIFADANGNPTKIPDYDNVQAVIKELNKILSESEQYSLDFGDLEDSANSIVRRPVGMCSAFITRKTSGCRTLPGRLQISGGAGIFLSAVFSAIMYTYRWEGTESMSI